MTAATLTDHNGNGYAVGSRVRLAPTLVPDNRLAASEGTVTAYKPRNLRSVTVLLDDGHTVRGLPDYFVAVPS